MYVRLVLRTVLFGLLAYVLVLPAVIVLDTVLMNIRVIPLETIGVISPVLFLALQTAVFLAVGYAVGLGVMKKGLANAALAGVLLAVGAALLDTIVLLILPKHHAHAHTRLIGPSYSGLFKSWFFVFWREIEIVFAIFGGWVGSRFSKPGLQP